MSIIVGIDVSKASLDAWKSNGKARNFPNTRKGFVSLMHWAADAGLFVMEATGSYHVAAADALHESGRRVSVVNPARAAHYARAIGWKNKTDACDAQVLAKYAQSNEVPLYVPPSAEIRELRGLVRHRDRLVEQQASLKALLKDPSVEAFESEQIREHLAFLKSATRQVEAKTAELVKTTDELSRRAELLRSIPGLGRITAWVILAQVGDLLRFSCAKELAAFVGVQPALRQSGTSLPPKTSMSKRGNAFLRKYLYMAALGATREDSPFHQFFLRMIEKGKSRKSAIGAVMHKLLRTAYGVVKSGKAFSPQRTPLTNP